MSKNKLSHKQKKLIHLILNNKDEEQINHFIHKHFPKHYCGGPSGSELNEFEFIEYYQPASQDDFSHNNEHNIVISTLIHNACSNTLFKLWNSYGYLPRNMTLDLDSKQLKGVYQYAALREWFKMCCLSISLIEDQITPPNSAYLKNLWQVMEPEYLYTNPFEHCVFQCFRQYMRSLFCSHLIDDEVLLVDYLFFIRDSCRDDEYEEDVQAIFLHNPDIKNSHFFFDYLKMLQLDKQTHKPLKANQSSSLKIEEHSNDEQDELNLTGSKK